MGLWVDRTAPRLEDLERIDTGVSQVATVEGIDVAAAIADVQDEISSQLERYLGRAEGGPVTLGDVVVTEQLRRWGAYAALAILYRNAYFNQMSDRYASRWKEYERRAGEARLESFETGVGRANWPLSRPSAPTVREISGTLPAGTYFLCVSTINAQGTESEAGETAVVTTQSARGLEISFGGGTNISSWNVYAGSSVDSLILQTVTPVAPGGTWQPGSSLQVEGKAPGMGQTADYFTKPANRLLRG